MLPEKLIQGSFGDKLLVFRLQHPQMRFIGARSKTWRLRRRCGTGALLPTERKLIWLRRKATWKTTNEYRAILLAARQFVWSYCVGSQRKKLRGRYSTFGTELFYVVSSTFVPIENFAARASETIPALKIHVDGMYQCRKVGAFP